MCIFFSKRFHLFWSSKSNFGLIYFYWELIFFNRWGISVLIVHFLSFFLCVSLVISHKMLVIRGNFPYFMILDD